ncbi:MAG: hypothetical protein K9K66_01465 [Desulfarculaceae bacterium]|nr:hypothetical protein [Desulfarculaceae bacterium]MCF8072382.1 hypothetical protein [Desulfarculaceae bacterium]MCF8100303.1 hypothetical protein [Desulfarculaceae bacterium]MCF8116124.1 hypothetical protein [Desulfarculaceae bacterium]
MKKAIVLGMFLAWLALMIPNSASAMCAYNHAKHRVTATFVCGLGCINTWSMAVDEHDCRPDKSGTLKVTYIDPEHLPFMECDVYNVDKHGWVKIYEDKLINFASDGSVKRTIYCVDAPAPNKK